MPVGKLLLWKNESFHIKVLFRSLYNNYLKWIFIVMKDGLETEPFDIFKID